MAQVRNNAPGLRGVNTENEGLVMLLPGETRELQVSDAERKNAEMGGLEFDPEPQEVRRGAGVDDFAVTAESPIAATVHPMPPGQDITRPEQPVLQGAVVAPWAMSGGTGSAAQTQQQLPGGEQSAADTSKQQENVALTDQQPAAKGAEAQPRKAKEKGAE